MRRVAAAVLLLAMLNVAQAEEPPSAGVLHEGKPASHWISELKKDDLLSRRKAAYALFKLGPAAKAAATPLGRAFEDEDDYVRNTAYKALIALGGDAKPAVKALRSALNDGRARVRQLALWALLRIDPATAFRDDDFDVRKAAVSAVMDPSDFLDEAVFAELIGRIGDEDEEIRARAATAIANAYIFHGVRRPYITKVKGRMAEVFKRMAAEDEEPLARQWAVYALRALAGYPRGPELAEEIFPVLLAATKDKAPDVRWQAFLSLFSVGRTDAAGEAACLAGLKDAEDKVRAAACRGLGRMSEGSPAAIEALIVALDDRDRFVRYGAAGVLGAFSAKSTAAVPALIARFRVETHPAVRNSIASALGELGPAAKPALADLVAAFDGDKEPSAALAYALLRLGAPNQKAALKRLVDVALSDVGGGARTYLGRLGATAAPAIPRILETLARGKPRAAGRPSERVSAAWTLLAMGPLAKPAVPALEALLRKDAGVDKDLADAARDALKKIRGH